MEEAIQYTIHMEEAIQCICTCTTKNIKEELALFQYEHTALYCIIARSAFLHSTLRDSMFSVSKWCRYHATSHHNGLLVKIVSILMSLERKNNPFLQERKNLFCDDVHTVQYVIGSSIFYLSLVPDIFLSLHTNIPGIQYKQYRIPISLKYSINSTGYQYTGDTV